MEFMSSSSIPGDALKPWIPVDGSQGDIMEKDMCVSIFQVGNINICFLYILKIVKMPK